MKKIIYYTSPPLLDYSIEEIKNLSQEIQINLVILVSPRLSRSSIFLTRSNELCPGIYDLDELSEELINFSLFKKYLNNCNDVKIIYFPTSKIALSKFYFRIFELIKKENFRIHHFDDISGLGLPILLRFWRKKIVLNVHDPVRHSGEKNLINYLVKRTSFLFTDCFVVFSKYSLKLFHRNFGYNHYIIQLNLLPYNFYYLSSLPMEIKDRLDNRINFLFFGRISPYKGIRELVLAFDDISKKYDNIFLTIAGSGKIDDTINLKNSKIKVLNRHIEVKEIANIFVNSDVLICPYKDATQSGVLMTAQVFQLPHIVSNTGALPDDTLYPELIYSLDDQNGLVEKMEFFINNYNRFRVSTKLKSDLRFEENRVKLLNMYNSFLD